MALTKSVDEIIDEDRTGLLGKHPTWERVRLGDIATVLNGFPFDSRQFSNSTGTPLIRIRDVVNGETETFYVGAWQPAYLVRAGELLVGMDGDFNCARWGGPPALLNQRVCKVQPIEPHYEPRLLDCVMPLYLSAIHSETSSVTVKHLSSRTVEDIALPLPPIEEQRRLAACLDELLGDLDAGKAELRVAQAKLTQYRQSLLKGAVEGTLTAEWRAQNPPQETGADLLTRILRERRARWEAWQLEKFEAQGKRAPLDWRTKYPSPVRPNLSGAPALATGWTWASLDELAWLIRNGLSERPTEGANGTPILRISAVRALSVNLNDVRYLPAPPSELQAYLIEEGDLLATRYNGSVDLLGVIAVVRGLTRPTVYPDKLIRIRLALVDAALANWIQVCAATGASRRHVEGRVKTTAGQTGISGEDIKKMPIPLPPLQELSAATRSIGADLDSSREMAMALERALGLATAQRQNILRAAFAGQLVPQDPNDEPASVLLERIAQARAAAPATGKARRLRKPKVSA